jgi:hypothetical protein
MSIKKELYGGREDGKLVHLPERLPYVLEVPSANFDIDIELEDGDPTKPLPPLITTTYYLHTDNNYKPMEMK